MQAQVEDQVSTGLFSMKAVIAIKSIKFFPACTCTNIRTDLSNKCKTAPRTATPEEIPQPLANEQFPWSRVAHAWESLVPWTSG